MRQHIKIHLVNQLNRPINRSNRPIYRSKPVTHAILTGPVEIINPGRDHGRGAWGRGGKEGGGCRGLVGIDASALQAVVSPAKSTSETETETETGIGQADETQGGGRTGDLPAKDLLRFRDPKQAWAMAVSKSKSSCLLCEKMHRQWASHCKHQQHPQYICYFCNSSTCREVQLNK